MSLINSKRVIRAGFLSFWRNGIVSVASLLVATITLSVITALLLLQAVLHFSLSQIQDKVDITIYMTNTAPEESILELKSSLEKLPEVSAVLYTSREDALENFKNLHQDDFLTLQALEELDENPLGASLNVKAKETSQYESITKFLEDGPALSSGSTPIIDKVNYHQNKVVIERLTSIINGARKLGLIVTIILVLISIIITFNTIRLTIYFAREEIGIMRLVGAENRYIRGPFMVEGILYGSIASVITLLIYLPVTYWLGQNMSGFLGMNLFTYYTHNIFQIFIIILLSGVFLGAVSSFLAIRKYLTK